MKNWMKYAVTILVTACITALATVTVMTLKENRELRAQLDRQTQPAVQSEGNGPDDREPGPATQETISIDPDLDFPDPQGLRDGISTMEEVTAYFD